MNLAPAKLFWKGNKSSILLGVGLAGVVITAVASGKASIKASQIIDEMEYTADEPPTSGEKVKAVWKCYIFTGICVAGTIGCIGAAHAFDLSDKANYLSAYLLTEKAYKELNAKAGDVLGKNKLRKIKDEIAKDDIRKNPPKESEVYRTGLGTIIMRDGVVGGPDFETDLEYLKTVFNALNYRLNSYEYVTVNDLRYELGLPQTPFWEDYGWIGGEQIEPYWSVIDTEKDLMMTDETDLKTIYVLMYNHPSLLPSG